MIRQLLTLARNCFIESVRQPVFFVMVVLCGLLQLLNTWGTGFTLGYSSTAEVSADNKLLLDVGLATVFVCAMLLAGFVATAVVSREIEQKTVLTVVSKPVARAVVVIGKYLGVSSAMLVAVVLMVLFLLLGIRHEVMMTAADRLDGPVLVFGTAAVVLALGVALWGNYFYGWYFSQTFVTVLLPAMLVAYLLVLSVSKQWAWQPITTDAKPQIMLACLGMTMAILVLTAVATAASTRLGQVMTIVTCASVFLLGLLSDYFFGRHAFTNEPVAEITAAEPADIEQLSFSRPGDRYVLQLSENMKVELEPGQSLYYGPNPNGAFLAVPTFEPFRGDVTRVSDRLGPGAPPGVMVVERADRRVTIEHIGGQPLAIRRPPEVGDYVFIEPTRVHPLPLAIWAVIPNMHHFWLVDAVTQNRPIPLGHMGTLAGYAAVQILVFLAVAVALFERRDVG